MRMMEGMSTRQANSPRKISEYAQNLVSIRLKKNQLFTFNSLLDRKLRKYGKQQKSHSVINPESSLSSGAAFSRAGSSRLTTTMSKEVTKKPRRGLYKQDSSLRASLVV